MVHYRTMRSELNSESPTDNRPLDATSNHRRESLSDLENSLLQFRKAKRAADESMRRSQDVPEPHSTDNTIFTALWEAHLADREALFDAMRRLDRAREDQIQPANADSVAEQEDDA